jgi:cysteine-rich repeat protein
MRVLVLPLTVLSLALASPAGARPFVPPPPCGNGFVDQGEDCDDGNLIDGDGCSSLCKLESDGGTRDTGVDDTGTGDPLPTDASVGDSTIPDDAGEPNLDGSTFPDGGSPADAAPPPIQDTGVRPDTGLPPNDAGNNADTGVPANDAGQNVDSGLIGDLVDDTNDSCGCTTTHRQAHSAFALFGVFGLLFSRRRRRST